MGKAKRMHHCFVAENKIQNTISEYVELLRQIHAIKYVTFPFYNHSRIKTKQFCILFSFPMKRRDLYGERGSILHSLYGEREEDAELFCFYAAMIIKRKRHILCGMNLAKRFNIFTYRILYFIFCKENEILNSFDNILV